MTTDIAVRNGDTTLAEALDQALASADLKQMTAAQRVAYYRARCESVGLNPLTQPFEYISFDGKMTLYTRAAATEQLRSLRRVSIVRIDRDYSATDEMLTVTAYGRLPDGREDSSTGVVCLKGLSGTLRANAAMKAETKAKRRLTLSICGLGMLDESEIADIPKSEAQTVTIDHDTGEVVSTHPLTERMTAREAPGKRNSGPAADAFRDRLNQPAPPATTTIGTKVFAQLHARAREWLGYDHQQLHDLALLHFSAEGEEGFTLKALTEAQAMELLSLMQAMRDSAMAEVEETA